MPLGPSQLPLLGRPAPNLGSGPTVDKAAIGREVADGLPNERLRIADALENQAFYDLDGERYAPRRESETEFDYAGRPQREVGFTQEVVDVLSEHQYGPGPTRTVDGDPAADALLQAVWETNHIDAVMQQAETLACLNDVAAVQVHCTNDPDRPVDLQLWGSEEFSVFPNPDDPRVPVAVVTIDRVNGQTRYRLWFADEVMTYVTEPYSPGDTAGKRLAKYQGTEPNAYGCLPFAFVHHRMPVRRFWTPGLGTFLRKAELRINAKLSELDELIGKYLRPIGVFTNVPPEYSPELGPGRFMRLRRGGTGYTGEGAPDGGEPSVAYLQAQLQADQVWLDVEKFANQTLEACRVPLSAVRMEQTGVASGVALVVEQAPLLTRARSRRPMFRCYETELARVVLRAYGAFHGRAELAAAAKSLRLLLSWPEPKIPVPGPDRDQADEFEVSVGAKSRVMLIQERYGMSRDQAIAHLKQVAKDNAEADAILPPAPPPAAAEEEPEEPEEPETPGETDGDG